VPLVFTPVERDGQVLVDGGLINPVPIAPTLNDPSALTIAVDLNGRAERLLEDAERVVGIEIETCRRCGAKLKVISSIEEQTVIDRILEHLGRAGDALNLGHASRGPPVGELPF
jgi:predicted acylesterase/phospholipase RssA